MRSIRVLCLVLCVVCICGIFYSCAIFVEDKLQTTPDGFKYYYDKRIDQKHQKTCFKEKKHIREHYLRAVYRGIGGSEDGGLRY